MSRVLLTLSTASGLTLCSWVYALVVGPHLEPPKPPAHMEAEIERARIEPPKGQAEAAAEWLPDQQWAQDAQKQVKLETGFVYYQEWEPQQKEGRILFSPFAAIWYPPDAEADSEPIRITSESALVQFERGFDGRHPDPGKIVAAALGGEVRIVGPDGIKLRGRNYNFSHSEMRLWSDNPVEFAGQGHHGTAKAVQVELIPGEDASDSISIAGIESVQLRKDVVFHLQAPDPEDKRRTIPVQVHAAGSFEYVMENRLAIFEEDVRLHKPTGGGQFDSLECDTLYLTFTEKRSEGGGLKVEGGPQAATDAEQNSSLPSTLDPPPSVARQGDFTGLEDDMTLARLKAEGSVVKVTSQENDLVAIMSQLIYDADSRTLTMAHPDVVRAHQGYSDLQSPQITMRHDEKNEIDFVSAVGPGTINVFDPDSKEHLLAGRWLDALTMTPEEPLAAAVQNVTRTGTVRWLTLTGQVLMQAPSEQVTLAAESLRLSLLHEPSAKKPATRQPSGKEQKRQIRVRPLQAFLAQNVSIISRELRAATQRMQVQFEQEVSSPQPTGTPNRTGVPIASAAGSNANGGTTPASQAKPKKPAKPPVILTADDLSCRVRLKTKDDAGVGSGTKAQIAEVWTTGRVNVRQANRDPQKRPLVAQTPSLHILNRSKKDQRLELSGDATFIQDDGMRIEGGNVVVDRGQNLATVTGPGVLQLPVTRDLEGKPLKTPQLLAVRWTEKMTFDGRQAQFIGGVRTTLERSTMACELMRIALTQRIDFQESGSRDGGFGIGSGASNAGDKKSERPELAQVFCKEGVTLDSEEYEEGKIARVSHAKFWEVTLDQRTGKMIAHGPGSITIRRRKKPGSRGIGLTTTPAANSTADTNATPGANKPDDKKPGWEYSRIDFAGLVDGNVRQRFTTFNERVQIVYGPVTGPDGTIDPDDLPKGGGWMRCKTLQVTQHKATKEQPAKIELHAGGNAELEGNSFSARADAITYDEGKDLYTLSSLGNRQAAMWRDRPGSPTRDRVFAQRMEFIPSRNQLNVSRATGFGVGN